MPNVLIRDLPEDIHGELERRARSVGQSLQQFLTAQLRKLAGQPTVADVFAKLENQSGGVVGFQQVVSDLSDERNS